MGITILPNYGAEAGKNIAQLGEALARIINPNLDFQEGLKKALAANPDLARELAAVERDNPGFLDKLGAGKLGQQIKTTTPSFSEMLQTSARAGFASLTPEERQLWATSRALGTTPTTMAVEGAVAPAVRGLAGTEQGKNMAARRAEAEVSGQTRGQRAEEDLGLTLYGLATNYLNNLEPDMQKRVGARAKIPGIFDQEDMILRAALEERLFRARTSTDFQESLTRLQMADAARWAQNTGVGKPPDWLAYLYGDASKLDPKTSASLSEAQGALGLERKATEYAGISNRVALTVDRINEQGKFAKVKMRDEERPLFLQMLQRDLDALARFGGPKLSVNYGEVPDRSKNLWHMFGLLGGGDRLYFTDATGNALPPSAAMSLIGSPEVNPQSTQTTTPTGPTEKTPEQAKARALELQAQGLSRNQILIKMRQEGYNIQ